VSRTAPSFHPQHHSFLGAVAPSARLKRSHTCVLLDYSRQAEPALELLNVVLSDEGKLP
jgi:hypothetical protein